MQFSADFVALHAHEADVFRAERKFDLRRNAQERDSGAEATSPVPSTRRHRWGHRAPRLALR